jgi:hypothetical protein
VRLTPQRRANESITEGELMDNHKKLFIAASVLISPLCGCGGGSATSPTLVNGHLVGQYGAKDTDASLQLTPTGGQLTLDCGWGGPLSQPATPDANGHFDVTGTLTTATPDEPIRYVGTITGNTLSLAIIQTDNTPNTTRETLTLIAGQKPPAFTGTCPG